MKLLFLITILAASLSLSFSKTPKENTSSALDTTNPALLSLVSSIELPPPLLQFELKSVATLKNLGKNPMKLTFRPPVGFPPIADVSSTLGDTTPEGQERDLLLGTLLPGKTVEVSMLLRLPNREPEDRISSLDLSLVLSGVFFVSSNLSETGITKENLLQKDSLWNEWQISISNTNGLGFISASPSYKSLETKQDASHVHIGKEALIENDGEISLRLSKPVEEPVETTARILKEDNEPEKEENPADSLIQKMYGNRVEELKKKKEKVVVPESEKIEADRNSDEFLTKIMMWVLGITLVLWVLSKYFERKYRREGAELKNEEESLEKQYTDKYNQAQKRNKKRN